MPVIAVVNHKGGSGKSTLASHVAAWFAKCGCSVMLGDVDRQQSSASWLRRRNPGMPTITPWAIDQTNIRRVPAGITHAVLDTPGGLHGFELARVVMFADVILMPVGYSVFDREAAAACFAELSTLPKVVNGKCPVAAIGMRFDGSHEARAALDAWAEHLGIPLLGALRETQLYVRSQEFGLTIFDVSERLAATDLAQWEPVLRWLAQHLQPDKRVTFSALDAKPATGQAAKDAVNPTGPLEPSHSAHGGNVRPLFKHTPSPSSSASPSALPGSLMPRQITLVDGGARLSPNEVVRIGNAAPAVSDKKPVSRHAGLLDALHIPAFFRRKR